MPQCDAYWAEGQVVSGTPNFRTILQSSGHNARTQHSAAHKNDITTMIHKSDRPSIGIHEENEALEYV